MHVGYCVVLARRACCAMSSFSQRFLVFVFLCPITDSVSSARASSVLILPRYTAGLFSLCFVHCVVSPTRKPKPVSLMALSRTSSLRALRSVARTAARFNVCRRFAFRLLCPSDAAFCSAPPAAASCATIDVHSCSCSIHPSLPVCSGASRHTSDRLTSMGQRSRR